MPSGKNESFFTCVPQDWKDVERIDVLLTHDNILVHYHHSSGLQVEEFSFAEAVEREDGTIKLIGTPFSYLEFNHSSKVILSRTADETRRAYTYLFKRR